MGWQLFVLFGLLLLLGMFSRAFAEGVSSLSKTTENHRIKQLLVVVVALGVSLPELFLMVVALIAGQGTLSIGNLIGANTINLSLLLGLVAIVSHGLPIIGEMVVWEVLSTVMAIIVPLLMMLDGRLTRVDGLVLLIVFGLLISELISREGKRVKFGWDVMSVRYHFVPFKKRLIEEEKELLKILFSIVVMAISSTLVVVLSTRLANTTGLGLATTGLVIMALGTSLPELVLVVYNGGKKSAVLVVFGLLAGVITNLTLLLGVLAVLAPQNGLVLVEYLPGMIFTLIMLLIFWLFVSRKRKLAHWESLIFLGCYFVFISLVSVLR